MQRAVREAERIVQAQLDERALELGRKLQPILDAHSGWEVWPAQDGPMPMRRMSHAHALFALAKGARCDYPSSMFPQVAELKIEVLARLIREVAP